MTPNPNLSCERQDEAYKKTQHLNASFEKRQREGWTIQITVWKRVPE